MQMRVKNGASACVHLLNGLCSPKLQSCQLKHLYYEVQLLGICCALAHPLTGMMRETAMFWHWLWVDRDRPRHGHVAAIMRKTRASYSKSKSKTSLLATRKSWIYSNYSQ